MADAFKWKVDGLSNALEGMQELKARTQSEVLRRALTPAAEVIRAEAERLAPYDPTPDGEPHLNQEIETTITVRRKSAAEAKIGFTQDAYWGQFQELGTEDHPPQPFLRPAADAKAGEAVRVFSEVYRVEVDKSVKRVRARSRNRRG